MSLKTCENARQWAVDVWLKTQLHNTIQQAIGHFKEEGMQVWSLT